MVRLIFRKGRVTKTEKVERKNGTFYNKPVEWEGRGYFLRGKFIHRYKNIALEILRKRVEEAGKKLQNNLSPMNPNYKTPFQLGKDICKDEYEVVNYHYNQQRMTTKKIEEKKQPYYQRINTLSKLKKIEKLKEELARLQGKVPTDQFDLSKGNLIVLQTIPEMMTKPKWRRLLRNLVINYKNEKSQERGFI